MEIGSRESGTCATVALWVERRVDIGEPTLLDIDASRRSEQRPVAGQSGRENAVEKIDPPRHTHPEVFRRTDAHEIPGFADRQHLGNDLEHLSHHGFWFTHAETTDRTPGNIRRGNDGRALPSQVWAHSALTDTEKRCPLLTSKGSERVHAAGEPTMCSVGRLSHRGELGWKSDKMIERHHDVRSPTELHFDRQLRCEFVEAAVNVRTERHPLFTDPHVSAQAENLESAAISQDRPVPTHEPM